MDRIFGEVGRLWAWSFGFFVLLWREVLRGCAFSVERTGGLLSKAGRLWAWSFGFFVLLWREGLRGLAFSVGKVGGLLSRAGRFCGGRVGVASVFMAFILGVMGGGFSSAWAQSGEREEIEEIVVVGYERSLENALNFKRAADVIVDAVMPEDIGKLPEVSIAEAIARLPGVVVERDRGNISGINLRGFGAQLQVHLFNGRQVASGEDSRAIRFELYPAELLNGAVIAKSATAGLPSGIAGAVNLHSIKPLEVDGSRMIINSSASYHEIAEDIEEADELGFIGTLSYVGQLLDGKLGVALGYSKREQSIASFRSALWNYGTEWLDDDGSNTAQGLRGPWGGQTLLRGGLDERDGSLLVLQWKPDDRIEANFDLFHSKVGFTETQRGFRWGNEGAGSVQLHNYVKDQSVVNGYQVGATIVQNGEFGIQPTIVNEEWFSFEEVFSTGLNVTLSESDNFTFSVDISYSEAERKIQFTSTQSKLQARDVAERGGVECSPGTVDAANKTCSKNSLSTSGYELVYDANGNIAWPSGWVVVYIGDDGSGNPTYHANNGSGASDATKPLTKTSSGISGHGVNVLIDTEDLTCLSITGSTCKEGIAGFELSYEANGEGQPIFTINKDLSDPENVYITRLDIPDSDITNDKVYAIKWDGEYLPDHRFFDIVSFGGLAAYRRKDIVRKSYFNVLDNPQKIPAEFLNEPLKWAGDFSGSPAVLSFDIPRTIAHFWPSAMVEQTLNDSEAGYDIKEDIFAVYLQTGFSHVFRNIDISGNIGLRIEHTLTESRGYRTEYGDPNGNGQDDSGYFIVENQYNDVLPALNMQFELSEQTKIRLAISQGMTRPHLGQLSSGANESASGAPTAYGGNPLLKPYRATQLDLSFENYVENGGFIVSGFYKDLDSFIFTKRQDGQVLPSGRVGTFVQPANAAGGYVRGVEISYTQKLTPLAERFPFLPNFIEDMGVWVQGTFVDSSINIEEDGRKFPLPGLAESSYSASLWYNNAGFEARIGFWGRDKILRELGDTDGLIYDDEVTSIDFYIGYSFSESSIVPGLRVYLSLNNLEDEPFRTYFGDPHARGRYEKFGRRAWAGLYYQF
ncbi:MAG: TonB-dependent receptor [Parvibaculales bacterium]